MVKLEKVKQLDVRVVKPTRESADAPSFSAALAAMLGQAPYWTTSVVEEEDVSRLKADEADVVIFLAPPDCRTAPSICTIIWLSDLEALRRLHDPVDRATQAQRDTLARCINSGYFACTSEELRETLLILFPGIRHRTYVLPSSLSIKGRPATTLANETAHWQELIRNLKRRSDVPKVVPVRVTAVKPREITSTCALSVVISCEGMDERLHNCLDRIAPQVEEIGGELLVLSRSDPGSASSRWPRARFHHDPAGNVLSLRAKGISMATGEVIAIMEDHGLPGKDWCQRVVELHRAHPTVPVIYGPVMHGGPFGITS